MRDRHVAARRLPRDRHSQLFGREKKIGVGLHGDMAMSGAVVAVTDETPARFGRDRIDISHRESRTGSDMKTGHYRGLCHLQLRSCIAS